MECPNVKINQGDHEGKTALYLAAENDHTQVVMELLKDPSVDVNKGKKEESCRVPDAECNHVAVRARGSREGPFGRQQARPEYRAEE